MLGTTHAIPPGARASSIKYVAISRPDDGLQAPRESADFASEKLQGIAPRAFAADRRHRRALPDRRFHAGDPGAAVSLHADAVSGRRLALAARLLDLAHSARGRIRRRGVPPRPIAAAGGRFPLAAPG